jgi:hypothetical protein
MTRDDVTQILGSETIRTTKSPLVVEFRPKGILSRFASHRAKLERLIAAFLASYPKVFYCPHEPDEAERSEARHRQWTQVAANTWMIPRGTTADEVMYDPSYPHGWTMYSGPVPLSERGWQHRTSDRVALLDELIRTQSVVAVVVLDPDGTPWLVGLPDPP